MESLVLTSEVLEIIDTVLIFTLLCLGFLLKHCVVKIPNGSIPAILTLISLTICVTRSVVYNEGTLLDAFINAIISSALAVGLHNGGKCSFRTIIKSLASSKKSDSSDAE